MGIGKIIDGLMELKTKLVKFYVHFRFEVVLGDEELEFVKSGAESTEILDQPVKELLKICSGLHTEGLAIVEAMKNRDKAVEEIPRELVVLHNSFHNMEKEAGLMLKIAVENASMLVRCAMTVAEKMPDPVAAKAFLENAMEPVETTMEEYLSAQPIWRDIADAFEPHPARAEVEAKYEAMMEESTVASSSSSSGVDESLDPPDAQANAYAGPELETALAASSSPSVETTLPPVPELV